MVCQLRGFPTSFRIMLLVGVKFAPIQCMTRGCLNTRTLKLFLEVKIKKFTLVSSLSCSFKRIAALRLSRVLFSQQPLVSSAWGRSVRGEGA